MRRLAVLVVTAALAPGAPCRQYDPDASILPYGFHFGNSLEVVSEGLLSTEDAAANQITSFVRDGMWIIAVAKHNGDRGAYSMKMGFDSGRLVEVRESIRGASYERCFAFFGYLLNLTTHRPDPEDWQKNPTLVGGDGRTRPFLYKASDAYIEVETDVAWTLAPTCNVEWRHVEPRYWLENYEHAWRT